jgi:hypothetical protein
VTTLLKPCTECGTLSPESRCPDHAYKRVETRRNRTYTQAHHAQPMAWRRLSRWLRAMTACEVCGTTKRLHVHHDRPNLGTYDRSGLRVLCARHHAMRDAEQRRGREPECPGDSDRKGNRERS